MNFFEKFRIFGSSSSNQAPRDFSELSEEELEAHLAKDTYGTLKLSDGIRPGLHALLTEGYKYDKYHDADSNTHVPVLMAAASREKLMDLFMELMTELGDTVDVVLETSHITENFHRDIYREHIDSSVLRSTLHDYEDLLVNDGNTGIAVLNTSLPQEVQFDEHKLMIIYGHPLASYEDIMKRHGLTHDQKMEFITEKSHIHSTNYFYYNEFQKLKATITGETPDVTSWT